MNTHSIPVLTTLLAVSSAIAGLPAAGAGSAFTYQGQLKQRGVPYDGLARFEFALWDADRAGREVAPRVLLDLDVIDGLFQAPLDFGIEPFDGDARWLEITVNTGDGPMVLSPRQEVTPAPYAFTALRTVGVDGHSLDGADAGPTDAVFVDSRGSVGIGTTSPRATLDVDGMVQAISLKLTDAPVAGHVLTTDANGVGTWQAPQTGGESLWLENRNDIYFTAGNVGIGTSTPATSLDVAGVASVDGFQMGTRVLPGHVLTADANGVGTWQAPPSSSDPVWSQASSNIYYDSGDVGIGTSSPTNPLHVISSSSSAILGENPSENTSGELGSEFGGVWGASTGAGGTGVYGEATAEGGEGVFGVAWAETGTNYGVRGEAAGTTGRGVYGKATGNSARGVYGEVTGTGGFGVMGQAPTGTAVYGESSGGIGVDGYTESASGYGVKGINAAGSGDAVGVYGESESPTGRGVYGYAASSQATTNFGVYGRANGDFGRGVYGESSGANAYAGYFQGRGYFSGNVGIHGAPSDAALHVVGDVEAGGFKYNAPKERHLSLPSCAFQPTYALQDWYTTYLGNIYVLSGGGVFHAPVLLPDGAVVTELTVYVHDNDPIHNFHVTLNRLDLSPLDEPEEMATVFSSGVGDEFGKQILTTTPESWPIDNSDYAYYIRVVFADTPQLHLRAAVLTYTVNEPD